MRLTTEAEYVYDGQKRRIFADSHGLSRTVAFFYRLREGMIGDFAEAAVRF